MLHLPSESLQNKLEKVVELCTISGFGDNLKYSSGCRRLYQSEGLDAKSHPAIFRSVLHNAIFTVERETRSSSGPGRFTESSTRHKTTSTETEQDVGFGLVCQPHRAR